MTGHGELAEEVGEGGRGEGHNYGAPLGGGGLQEGTPWGLGLLLRCLPCSVREEELIVRKKNRRKERRKRKGSKRKKYGKFSKLKNFRGEK
jgi:hypothetical protein